MKLTPTFSFCSVIRLDGAVPVKYGLRLNAEEKYHAIKQQLSGQCDIPAEQLMLAEVIASMIKVSSTNAF